MHTDACLRRTATDSSLIATSHNIREQLFQRYNLARFPCKLKNLQQSYEKLIEICAISPDYDDEKWLSKLNGSKWFRYISKALRGAASLAKLLNYHNIQLAGSDVDHSCLMASLIQVLLRPNCRTMKGFCELIVREWIIRGHPFCERFGQLIIDEDGNDAQESPVFLLFLDCVHQLIVQNPFAFEFTEYFLIELYHGVCCCYHHTFVFNSVTERLRAIDNCPKNILLLSAFDFSLYLDRDTYRLLKNHTSTIASSRNHVVRQSFYQPKIMSTKKEVSSIRRSTTRAAYCLEAPKPVNFVLDTPLSSSNESIPTNIEQCEYDSIESPQIFTSNLYVDWRMFNIVLWSKCYCRYDQNYLPTLREKQLSFEISCLMEDIQKSNKKLRRQKTIGTHHSITHANSWHPQMLETRI